MPMLRHIFQNKMFDPFSNTWISNKFEIYKELQAMEVAYYSKQYGGYVITRYDDVKYALKNHNIFSSAKGNLINESKHRMNRTLGASDDPKHSILKNIVKEAYSKSNVNRVKDCFNKQAIILLSQANPIFNMSAVAEEASAWACAEILNLPYDKTKIKDLVLGILRYSKQSVTNNIDQTYYTDFFNLVSDLVKNNVPAAGPGIYQEFMANSQTKTEISLFTGPTISGAGSLTGALEFLTFDIYNEKLFNVLLNDRSLSNSVVSESLRYNCSSGRKVRTVTQSTTLHNIDLKRNDKVILSLEAANRDPSMFSEPDKFIVGREDAGNLAYGYGVHACISAAISNELLNCWITILLDTLGEYTVITNPNDFVYQITSSGNQDSITNLIVEKKK